MVGGEKIHQDKTEDNNSVNCEDGIIKHFFILEIAHLKRVVILSVAQRSRRIYLQLSLA